MRDGAVTSAVTGADHERNPRTNNAPDTETATAVFDLLSDETRVRIVAELDSARRAGEDGLRFSTLRERVGARDSGRFNYHLKKLRGDLVQKDGERYILTPTGATMAETLNN
jgi:DNA-binding transcriptional ArsR family regulator